MMFGREELGLVIVVLLRKGENVKEQPGKTQFYKVGYKYYE